jgi:hypothetical protein
MGAYIAVEVRCKIYCEGNVVNIKFLLRIIFTQFLDRGNFKIKIEWEIFSCVTQILGFSLIFLE